jgi:hypothetical protein
MKTANTLAWEGLRTLRKTIPDLPDLVSEEVRTQNIEQFLELFALATAPSITAAVAASNRSQQKINLLLQNEANRNQFLSWAHSDNRPVFRTLVQTFGIHGWPYIGNFLDSYALWPEDESGEALIELGIDPPVADYLAARFTKLRRSLNEEQDKNHRLRALDIMIQRIRNAKVEDLDTIAKILGMGSFS